MARLGARLTGRTEPLRIREFEKALPVPYDRLDPVAIGKASERWARSIGLPNDPLVVKDTGTSYAVSTSHVTGVVRVGALDIEIRPKFLGDGPGNWQTVLWRILAAVDGGLIDDQQTSALSSDDDAMTDLLADVFVASWTRGTARGLPRHYRPLIGSGHVVRGTLDASRLTRWIAQPWEVPYATDELSEDTPIARLLRWAANQLGRTVHSPSRRRRLRDISGVLTDAGRLAPGLAEARRLHLGPQHQGLKPALEVAILLLEGRGVTHAAGDFEISGFLWKSDVVYERFVYFLARKAAHRLGLRVSKHAIGFGELIRGHGSKLATTPDVVFRDAAGEPVAVLDAKYKTFGTRPKSADTYQILTGGHVLGCQRVALTYPHDTDTEIATWRVASHLGGKPMAVSALPLNLMLVGQPYGISNLVNELVVWLSEPVFPGLPVNSEASAAGPADGAADAPVLPLDDA